MNNSAAPLDLESCSVQGVANVITTVTTAATPPGQDMTTYVALPNGTTETVTPSASSTTATPSTVTATLSQYLNANGTLGGAAASSGVPANSTALATCTVSVSQFPAATSGASVSGGFEVELAGPADSYPAGTETTVSFLGTWS